MECFERGIFHDRGKSAEIREGLEGRSEVDQEKSGETNLTEISARLQ